MTRQQWFEESLCEAFSLFTLKKMAEHWQDNPPYPNWQSYAPELQNYVDDLMQEKHRRPTLPVSEWYQQQRKLLEKDPYAKDRVLNEKMATTLLELFENEPENWAAINYLNLGEDNGVHTMDKYLADWYNITPESHQDIVVKIQQLFKVNQ